MSSDLISLVSCIVLVGIGLLTMYGDSKLRRRQEEELRQKDRERR